MCVLKLNANYAPDIYEVPTECLTGVEPGMSHSRKRAEVEVSEVDS